MKAAYRFCGNGPELTECCLEFLRVPRRKFRVSKCLNCGALARACEADADDADSIVPSWASACPADAYDAASMARVGR